MASPLPAWGLLFSWKDPNVLGLHKSLSGFAASHDGKSHLGTEETLLSNNWSQWPEHHSEYYPLLRAGFIACWSCSRGLKLIAKHAAVMIGVNILHHFFSANGALSSGWRSLLFEILLCSSASLIWWISLDITSACLCSNFFHASLQIKTVYLYPNSLAWLGRLLRSDILFPFWSLAPVREETSELGGSPWASWC